MKARTAIWMHVCTVCAVNDMWLIITVEDSQRRNTSQRQIRCLHVLYNTIWLSINYYLDTNKRFNSYYRKRKIRGEWSDTTHRVRYENTEDDVSRSTHTEQDIFMHAINAASPSHSTCPTIHHCPSCVHTGTSQCDHNMLFKAKVEVKIKKCKF